MYKKIFAVILPFIAILVGILSAESRHWFPAKDDGELKLALMGGAKETFPQGGVGIGLRSPLTLNGVNELYVDEDEDDHFDSLTVEARVGQWNEFWCSSEDNNNDLFPDTCEILLGANNCMINLHRDSSRSQTWNKSAFMMPSQGQSGPVFVYHDLNCDGIVDTRVKTNTERKPQYKWVLKENRWIKVVRTIDQYAVEVDDNSARYLFFSDGQWLESHNVSKFLPSMNISTGVHEQSNP